MSLIPRSGQGDSRKPSRKITSRQAQQEHESLRLLQRARVDHQSANWQQCASCRSRFTNLRVWVDGKPVT